MKRKPILLILVLIIWGNLSHSQSLMVDFRLHIFASEETGELAMSIQNAENLIAKLKADFDGTTYNLATGNAASLADTDIDFCPEILVHYNDDELFAYPPDLDAAYGSNNKYDLFVNYYGWSVGSVMLKGRMLSGNSSWIGTIHGKLVSPTSDAHVFSHEVGHSFGLIHGCNACDANCTTPQGCEEFMIASTHLNTSPPKSFYPERDHYNARFPFRQRF